MSKLTPKRQPRALLVLIVMAVLLALPFQAFASKGSALSATVQSLIGTASAGQLVAFSASFHNDTTTSMPHFAFVGEAQGATFDSFYPEDENCEGSGSRVTCQFGTLGADASKSLIVAFKVKSNVSQVSFTGTFSADSTTKSGKGGASKRDSWSGTATASVNASGDFYATWQPPGKAGTFGPFGIGQKAHVATEALENSYVARIQQTDETFDCTGPGWGKTVDMQVAGGDVPVELTITFERQSGLTPQQLNIMHILDDGTCDPVPPAADCKTSDATKCFVAYWTPGNGNTRRVEAFIRLPHTSRAKGF